MYKRKRIYFNNAGGRGFGSRKIYKRSKTTAIVPVQVPRQIGGYRFPAYFGDLPTKKFVRLKYVSNTVLGAAMGAVGVHQYRANGMYDPDYTGAGHQPYGFDQLMAKYNHFTVLKCKCHLKITSVVAQDSVYGICLTDTNGQVAAAYAMNGYETVMEMPFRSKTLLHSIPTDVEASRSCALWFDAAKFFGKSQSQIAGERDYRGTVAADPNELAYFEVFCLSPGGIEVNDKACQIELDYFAVFTEPKQFTSS